MLIRRMIIFGATALIVLTFIFYQYGSNNLSLYASISEYGLKTGILNYMFHGG